MKKAVAVLAACVAMLPSPARAVVTFDYIFDDGTPKSVSSDGSVVAGTIATGGDIVSFRWTQATGLVTLGRPMQVGGAGEPAISADGTRIGFGIGSLPDGAYTTQGRWTLGSGWQDLMPPAPADGGTQDGSYGSVWALSGDGNTVVGLYNRPGPGNRAHASKWTQATGVVDLGGTTTGQASRANAVNYYGTVIGGWVETPQGPWRPAVWANGSLQLLTDYDPLTTAGIGEVRAVSMSGDILAGFAREQGTDPRGVAKWTRGGGTYGAPEFLGGLGTDPNERDVPYAVSNNGKVIVGFCTFDGTPFNVTGFIWTESTGVQDINTWLADNGVFVDPNFTIQNLDAMTPDGTKIFGHGQMLTAPFTRRAFRITVPPMTLSVPEPGLHAGLELSQPQPNPSSSLTRLDFTLGSPASVDLSVYDASGRRVATLLHSDLPAGRRSVTWDGREASGRPVATGVYFARLVTPQGSALRRIVRMH